MQYLSSTKPLFKRLQATSNSEPSDIFTAAMGLLPAFRFLYYFTRFLCSAVPHVISAGCSSVLLNCRLLLFMGWLILIMIKMICGFESQDEDDQVDQAVTSLSDHSRQFYQDVRMARGASQGKNQSSHESLLRGTGRCLLMCILQ